MRGGLGCLHFTTMIDPNSLLSTANIGRTFEVTSEVCRFNVKVDGVTLVKGPKGLESRLSAGPAKLVRSVVRSGTNIVVTFADGTTNQFDVCCGPPPYVPQDFVHHVEDALRLTVPQVVEGELKRVVAQDFTRRIEDSMRVSVPQVTEGELKRVVDWFTSVIYPFVVEDDMAVQVPSITKSTLVGFPTDNMRVTVPSVTGGTLNVVVRYTSMSADMGDMTHQVPAVVSGLLTETIRYLTMRADMGDVTHAVPAITAGELKSVIVYVVQRIDKDELAVSVPTVVSGELK